MKKNIYRDKVKYIRIYEYKLKYTHSLEKGRRRALFKKRKKKKKNKRHASASSR